MTPRGQQLRKIVETAIATSAQELMGDKEPKTAIEVGVEEVVGATNRTPNQIASTSGIVKTTKQNTSNLKEGMLDDEGG